MPGVWPLEVLHARNRHLNGYCRTPSSVSPPPAPAAAPATADTSGVNSTAEGDPGGGDSEAAADNSPDNVFSFIEFITRKYSGGFATLLTSL